MSLVAKHPLVTFFVSVYVLSWAIEAPLVFLRGNVTATQGLVLVILASNVPSVVAIVLTAVLSGRRAVGVLLRRLLKGRVGVLWYGVVILGPVVLAAAAAAINTVVGGPTLGLAVSGLTVVITLAFSIFPGSSVGEEIGWRGFALPRLQAKQNALGASLLLGVLWGVWHLPLWLAGDPVRTPALYVAFLASAVAMSVILAWVYNSTGGSLLMVVILHATANLPITLTMDFLGTRATLPVLLYFGLLIVAAIVVIIVAGPENLSRTHRQQTESGSETTEAPDRLNSES